MLSSKSTLLGAAALDFSTRRQRAPRKPPPTMAVASFKEQSVHNNAVDQKKRARHHDRLTRVAKAHEALDPKRDTFDTQRDFDHAIKNYAVALLDV